MKAMLLKKINNFSVGYEKLDNRRKKMVLYAVFAGLSIIFIETLFLESVDKFNQVKIQFTEEEARKASLNKEKSEVLLKNAYKTEKSLNTQKEMLLKEINDLLKSNKNNGYIAPETVPQLIENIVRNVEQLNLISFKNIPNKAPNVGDNSNLLIKHNFVLKIEGNFQNVYEFIIKLENISGINLSSFDMKKQNDKLVTVIEFYVLNTNKNLLNF